MKLTKYMCANLTFWYLKFFTNSVCFTVADLNFFGIFEISAFLFSILIYHYFRDSLFGFAANLKSNLISINYLF